MKEKGIPLHFDSIRLSTHRGWVVGNVRFYSSSPDNIQPLLSAEKLYIQIWPVHWKDLVRGDWHFSIYAKDIALSLNQFGEDVLFENHSFRIIRRLKVDGSIKSKNILIEQGELQWGGMNVDLSGMIALFEISRMQTSLSAVFQKRIVNTIGFLSTLQFEQSPQVTLWFDIHPSGFKKSSLDAHVSASGLRRNGRTYSHFSGKLNWQKSQWTLSSCLSQSDGKQLVLDGLFSSTNAQLSVDNTLTTEDFLALPPTNMVQSILSKSGLRPIGALDFIAKLGPNKSLFKTIEVEVQKTQFRRDSFVLDPLTFRLRRNGNQLHLTEGCANGGALTGQFQMDLASKAWEARVQAQCNPASIGTLAGSGLQKFVKRFTFPNNPPKADLIFSQTGGESRFRVSGTLMADEFICGGVPIDHFETFMVYSNQYLDLLPLYITHEKEQFNGSVQVDFRKKFGFFAATNSFSPIDVARILAPEKRTVLEKFHFNGPIESSGTGQVDYGAGLFHSFHGIFRGENIEFNDVTTRLFCSDLEGDGTHLFFTNTVAQLYGGLVEGHAKFDLFTQDGAAPYQINATVTQMELAQILEQFSERGRRDIHGPIHATLTFSADAKTNFWDSVQGTGQVNIENGRLTNFPLLGGFSRIIRFTIPSFDLFSFTTFFADYKLYNRVIWSDNAQIGGTFLNAHGRGSWSPQNGLDFVVVAEPLRTTHPDKNWYQIHLWASDFFKGGTAPIFRFFKFRLSGSLHDPKWRFVNLPKTYSGRRANHN